MAQHWGSSGFIMSRGEWRVSCIIDTYHWSTEFGKDGKNGMMTQRARIECTVVCRVYGRPKRYFVDKPVRNCGRKATWLESNFDAGFGLAVRATAAYSTTRHKGRKGSSSKHFPELWTETHGLPVCRRWMIW